jgi:hypothetical protein
MVQIAHCMRGERALRFTVPNLDQFAGYRRARARRRIYHNVSRSLVPGTAAG